MSSGKIKWHKIFDSREAAVNSFPERRVIKIMAGNKFICFTRNSKNFYAFDDRCPHQGKPLVHGECNEKGEIVCPFHQYHFDLLNGRGHGLYLKTYPVEEREDGIYVGFEKGFLDFF